MSDLVLYNGKLITMDPATEGATALHVHNGKIALVGRTEDVLPLADNAATMIDLEGAVLLPGFNDAHIHLWKVGALLTSMLDLRGVRSIAAMMENLRAFAVTQPEDGWILARGYNEAHLAEGRHPTRADLDAALPGRAVWLVRTCAHIAVASTRALELAGIEAATESPRGGVIERDNTGNPTGVFHESAMGLVSRVIPPPTTSDYKQMIRDGGLHLLSQGVTSATDPAVTPELIDAYTEMDADRALPIRMSLMAIVRPDGGNETLPLPKRMVTTMLRVDSVKFFADGGLSGATAALGTDYKHLQTRGVLRFTDEEELYTLARQAREAGLRIGIHAIGDVAIDQVLRVYERLGREISGPANRIEHFGLPDAGMLMRAANLGVIAVPQAIFIEELGENFRAYLPDEYLERVYPLYSIINAGIPLALSSDAPVVRETNPLAGIRAAVTRSDRTGIVIAKKEALNVNQALYSYTMGGA
ncbi:MAG: amidohydrolase, partial [Candidatus Sumerlaeia bacterium]|nr:amidohydrolase [Candidatus Sumerlaeia bacterium]